MKTFYERVYPLMYVALQMAKENGHVIGEAKRAKPDPPNRINTGQKWCASCNVCKTIVWAGLDDHAQIIVGGVPLLMTCEQAQRFVAKWPTKIAELNSSYADPDQR